MNLWDRRTEGVSSPYCAVSAKARCLQASKCRKSDLEHCLHYKIGCRKSDLGRRLHYKTSIPKW